MTPFFFRRGTVGDGLDELTDGDGIALSKELSLVSFSASEGTGVTVYETYKIKGG